MGWPGALVGLRVVAVNYVVPMVFNILGTGTTAPMCAGLAALRLRGKNVEHGPRILRVGANGSFLALQETGPPFPLPRGHASAAAMCLLNRDALSKPVANPTAGGPSPASPLPHGRRTP